MKKIYEKIKNFLSSTSFGNLKLSNKFLYIIGSIVIAILIFSAGVSVGFHKASFGRAWGDNYERNFGMMKERPVFGKDNFPNAHGAIGKIIKIELPTIIVQDKDGIEKVVLIKDNDTKIQKINKEVKANELSVSDFVVVIGSPDEKGQIEAKFIRIMPFGMPVPPPALQAPDMPPLQQ